MQKSNLELWDLYQSCYIITEKKHVKFQSIPFCSYGNTSLHAKHNQEFLSRKNGQKANQSYGTCANHVR
jgi:hypothetical protein